MYPDRITDNILSRTTKKIRKSEKIGYNLLCGNCEGCRPKECTVNHPVKGQIHCWNTSNRTFSIESTGVDCDLLHYDLYGEWLPWFFRGTGFMPAYITRYTGFFTDNSKEECLDIFTSQLKIDKSYCETIPPVDSYVDKDIVLVSQDIPIWIHNGQKQLAYTARQG